MEQHRLLHTTFRTGPIRAGGRNGMENKSHKGNYKGTTHMNAKNQDMAFVNDNVEEAKSVTPFSDKKTDDSYGKE
jgi:hypothetical protein